MTIVFANKKKLIKLISSLLVFTLLLTSVLFCGVKEVFSSAKRKLPIYYVVTESKEIAISFDCAWGVDYTNKLLETMKEHQVYCTFFMVEFWAKKHPDYVKKIIDYGHEIGTHSATHPYMSKLSKQDIVKELTSSITLIENITSRSVTLFRPPYGDYNNLLIDTAKELGLFTIQWSIDSLDWKDLSATEIEKRVVSKAHNGGIVLFHNQGLHTAEALPSIIKSLKNEGYVFKKISEMVYKDNYEMLPDGGQKLIKES